jgi:CubicO group peptidase (beta-lactamase class C family)
MEQTIHRYGEAMDLPGARFHYTNLGYGVLTHLIERVSGFAYTEHIRRSVLLPLGMNRSSIGIGPGLESYQAKCYGPDGLPIPFYTFDHRGGSALYASIHDLLRFGMFHLKTPLDDQKRILTDASLDDMRQIQATIAPGLYYGTGWWVRDDGGGHRIVEHLGGMPGVGSDFLLLPDEELVTAVVVNGDSKGLKSEVTQEILTRLAPDYATQPSTMDILNRSQVSETLTSLVGEWRGQVSTSTRKVPLSLSVKECGDVIAQVGDQLKTLVNDIALENGYLKGRMLGRMDTTDADRATHSLRLDLALRDDRLSGALIAESDSTAGRAYFALPFWTSLSKSD